MRTKKVSNTAIVSELRSLAMVSGGMILGSMGGKAIDKVLKVDPSIPGFQAKKFVRPAALLGAGIIGGLKLKNKDLKMLSAGVGASGVVSTVKVVLKKDLLSGLEGPEPLSIYQDPIGFDRSPYEPSLPVLASPASYEKGPASFNSGNVEGDYQDANFEII